MARPDPTRFREKTRLVQTAVAAARGADRDHYDFSREIAPGVRVVPADSSGCALAFSLWTRPEDIAEICADAAVPVASALLAIDGALQAVDLAADPALAEQLGAHLLAAPRGQ